MPETPPRSPADSAPRTSSVASRFLARAESFVLALVAIVLLVLAILLLGNSVISLGTVVLEGKVRDFAIEILDSVLLVMMMLEIVYTVTVSLESHTLVPEPFLIIGAIAAIRRMLVITAESKFEVTNPTTFQSLLIELALLALIVIAMALSIYVLRRSERFSRGEGHTEGRESNPV